MSFRLLMFFSGIDSFDAHVVHQLTRRGITLHVVHNGRDGQTHPKLDPRIPQTVIAYHPRKTIHAARALRRLLKSERFDILHTTKSRALTVSLLATLGMHARPKLVAYRGYIGHNFRFDPTGYIKFLNPRVDHIICLTRPVREYLIKQGVPPAKLTVIQKGLSPDWIPSADAPPTSDFGVPESSIKVCFVGNAAGRRSKGLDVLFQAWNLIPADLAAHLLIIGKTDERDTARAAGLDRVHFLGFRTDAWALMKQCDVFVLPSRTEAMGRSLLEAMAIGLAPVVTDSGGPGELVRNEVDGIVVPIEDAPTLAGAIERLIRDPEARKRMAASSKARAEHDFSLDAKVDEVLAVYDIVLSGTPDAVR